MQIEEQQRLEKLMLIIKENMKCFYEIGLALKEIRDNRLYREFSDTFEKFCRDHMNISRAHAYRQIASAEVMKNLSPIGDIFPLNESQTRFLTKLEPNEQKLAWQCALDIARAKSGQVTSFDIAEAVDLVKKKSNIDVNQNKLEQIDVISVEFKKSYESFFEVIKNAMNNEWKTTSKETIFTYLKALIKFLKIHD